VDARITAAVIGVGLGLLLTAPAVAGGEPKNDWPFTRVASARLTADLKAPQVAAAPRGEPKNELPFTRLVAGASVR
jgi:hypothetical protein